MLSKEKPAKPPKPAKPAKPTKSAKPTKATKNKECPNGKCDWDGVSIWGRLMNGIRKETCSELMDRIVERTVYATPTFANTTVSRKIEFENLIHSEKYLYSLDVLSFVSIKPKTEDY